MDKKLMSRMLVELTSLEVTGKLSKNTILCLPVGSIEQHGPHLPLNTDLILAEEFAKAIIKRWSDKYDLWILPSMAYGISKEHSGSVGTISLSVENFSKLIIELGKEFVRSTPTKNLLIINGHGGNRGIFEALAYDLKIDIGLNICVIHPSALSKIKPDSDIPEIHGGKSETSIMLALAPQVVRASLINEVTRTDEIVHEIQEQILNRGVTWPWQTNDLRIANNGIIGNPKDASRELGEKMVESAVEECGKILERLVKNCKSCLGPD